MINFFHFLKVFIFKTQYTDDKMLNRKKMTSMFKVKYYTYFTITLPFLDCLFIDRFL